METVDVAIVGSGFAGLGMAIALERTPVTGFEDVVVLERAQDVGGTWLANRYPGCACNVPSRLYSFSFAPDPGWQRSHSGREVIQGYLKGCAHAYGVRKRIRFGCALTGGRWDDDAGTWSLETTRGPLRARVLVVGAGALSTPQRPALPGLASFAGPVVHSAEWDPADPLAGKRVAVVGTGASAAQLVPAIAPEVERLHVFQRTPAWVLPRRGRPIGQVERRLFRRFPSLARLVRAGLTWGRELYALPLLHPRFSRVAEPLARVHLARQVADPELRARLAPSYPMGCRRTVLSNEFYPALTRPNVELVTEPIASVVPDGIVTTDGTTRAVDRIVLATGFAVADPPFARLLRGRDGRTLAEHWAGSPRAYRGTAVAGFPNLFVLLGPNTGLGHTSVLLMLEAQIGHVMDALRALAAQGGERLEVRPEAEATWTAAVDRRMRTTVWSSGACRRWYLDAAGRNSTLWPGLALDFIRRLRRWNPAAYALR